MFYTHVLKYFKKYSILIMVCSLIIIKTTTGCCEDTNKPGWAPFTLPWDDSPVDISFVFEKEKPAGKHGFLKAKDGKFVFEDGTEARFWGTNFNSGANFPTHEQSEIIAKRLAKFGVNIMRTHQLDSEWATPNIFQFNRAEAKDNTRSFDPESMDRLDYLIYCLKNEGIYVYIDLLTYRQFLPGDDVDSVGELPQGARPYCLFDKRLIELQKEFCKNFWAHANPYTGVAYKDEPAIVLTELTNENDPFIHKVTLEPYRSRLEKQYRKWASDKNINLDNEKIDFTNPDKNIAEFFIQIITDYNKEMMQYLKNLGVKIPITGTNWSINPALLKAQLVMDYTDSHSYWNFPFWVGSSRETETAPMVGATFNVFSSLTFFRTLGLPFCVSEWDQPWPSEWRAESSLVYAAVASFQEWGGVIIHTYRYSSWIPENSLGGGTSTINGVMYRKFFDAFNDPAKFGLFPHAALIFRRSDVMGGKQTACIKIDGDDPSWLTKRPSGFPGLGVVSEQHKTGMLLPGESGSADVIIDADEPFMHESDKEVLSDTKELWRNWEKKIGWIDSPYSKVVYGFWGKEEPVSLNGLKLDVKTDFATIAFSSLTDEPIEKSESILLTAVGRCENTGAKFNEQHTQMLDFGRPPVLIEVIEAEIELKTEIPHLKVWLISEKGEAAAPLETTYENGTLKFKIGPQPWYNPSTIYYLIRL